MSVCNKKQVGCLLVGVNAQVKKCHLVLIYANKELHEQFAAKFSIVVSDSTVCIGIPIQIRLESLFVFQLCVTARLAL